MGLWHIGHVHTDEEEVEEHRGSDGRLYYEVKKCKKLFEERDSHRRSACGKDWDNSSSGTRCHVNEVDKDEGKSGEWIDKGAQSQRTARKCEKEYLHKHLNDLKYERVTRDGTEHERNIRSTGAQTKNTCESDSSAVSSLHCQHFCVGFCHL